MWVGVAHHHEKRFVARLFDELARLFGHLWYVAAAGDFHIPGVNFLWLDVNLSDNSATAPGRGQELGQALNIAKRVEIVRCVGEAVLAALMRVQPGVERGPARAARRDAGETVGEPRAGLGQFVDVRRPRGRVAVAAGG